MRSSSLVAGLVLLGAAPMSLAVDVPAGTFADLDTSPTENVGAGTYEVLGALAINGVSFAPTLLTIDGDGGDAAPHSNGEVFFNSGIITPGEIQASGETAIYANGEASTEKLTLGNGNVLVVANQLTVAAGSVGDGSLNVNNAEITVSNTGTLTVGSFVSTGVSSLYGRGSVVAGSFSHAGMIFSPGDDDAAVGVLSLTAPGVSFADSAYFIDVLDTGSGFEADLITLNGAVSAGGNLLVNDVTDVDSLLSVGDKFLVLDATTPITSLAGFSASGTVYDASGDNEIGYFVPVLENGNVFVQIVPEPAIVGLLGLLATPLRRRRI